MFVNEKLQEFERYIYNKKVALIGLGASNIPLIDYFVNRGAHVTVFDKRNMDEIDKNIIEKIYAHSINFSFGEHNLISLIGYDLILRSPTCRPDIPELKAESIRGAIITSEIELFIEMCPGKVIGVTGSNGKTTTANLIYSILNEKGYECFIGGNMGTSLFEKLPEMKPECFVVLELSSFQLMGLQTSPEIAVITNVSPNHLNIHNNYEEYIDCKKNIYRYQSESGKLVLNYDNDVTKHLASEAQGKVRLFSSKTRLDNGVIYDNGVIKSCSDGVRMHIMSIDDSISIHGNHNYENICAAIAATEDLVEPYIQLRAIAKFKGVEHRLELVRKINDIKWYNDSAATTPAETIAGLKSFDEKVVLITGGFNNDLDYSSLSKAITENVKKLILTGQNTDIMKNLIKEQLEKSDNEEDLQVFICNTLDESVQKAYDITRKNENVVFSPASVGFDVYKNFRERGETFKTMVFNLETENALKQAISKEITNIE